MLRITLFLSLFSAPAFAHTGHLIDAAGHDHWVAGAAIAIALGLGIREVIKGPRKSDDEDSEIDDADGEELQEA